jgi:hypothetical protein
MTAQQLPIGTMVEFALATDEYPAWSWSPTHTRVKPSGKMGRGYVVESHDAYTLRVQYHHPQDGLLRWSWPLPGHAEYNEDLAGTNVYPRPLPDQKKIPIFRAGDIVKFEATSQGYPLWYMDDFITNEHTGTWREGVVINDSYYTHALCTRIQLTNGETLFWRWPLPGSQFYSSDQWDREGYVRHADERKNL